MLDDSRPRTGLQAPVHSAPLRLLHVIPSFTTGGVPIRLVNIANRLGGDFRHLVLALDGVTSAAERLRPEVDHELVTLAIDKSTPVRNLWRFHSTLAALRPDLLLTYNWGAIDWVIVNSVCPSAAISISRTASARPR